jgi:MOSC domain-containing protein YiiM
MKSPGEGGAVVPVIHDWPADGDGEIAAVASGMREAGRVEAVCVGRVVERPGGRDGGAWASAFEKRPAAGAVRLGVAGFEGDEQADQRFHGGPEKAALFYCGGHYPAWRIEHDWPEAGPGAFGENLTVTAPDELGVCVGDVWQVGLATVEVSQPRAPCWKIDARWQRKGLTAAVIKNGRCGWYVRVKEEGDVEAGDAVTLVERPRPAWTIKRVHEVTLARKQQPAAWEELVAVAALSREWTR